MALFKFAYKGLGLAGLMFVVGFGAPDLAPDLGLQLDRQAESPTEPWTVAKDNSEGDDYADECPTPRKCLFTTIDAACFQMACHADVLECEGDYSSGDCHSLREAHELACELASPSCGDELPTERLDELRSHLGGSAPESSVVFLAPDSGGDDDGVTKKDLEKKGYKCTRGGINDIHCEKAGEDTMLCDGNGKNCIKSPFLTLRVKMTPAFRASQQRIE
ncbi:MAG: hypothetical protein ACI8RZ_004279 [Myxococcota bacterium]|jgi:hypothetical protein